MPSSVSDPYLILEAGGLRFALSIHGYAMVQRIHQISKDSLRIRRGSLYPALYRLETPVRGHLVTMWMAGGGVKKGLPVGRADDIGLRAVERPVHVHDIHATIPWRLGLDHVKVTYLHNGRSERPTIVSGEPIREMPV